MAIEILCESEFTNDELAEVDRLSTRLGITRDEFFVRSVRHFADECLNKAKD